MKLLFALLAVINADTDPVRVPVLDCDMQLVAMAPNGNCAFIFDPDLKEDLVLHPDLARIRINT